MVLSSFYAAVAAAEERAAGTADAVPAVINRERLLLAA
jgi:hypothetical protein